MNETTNQTIDQSPRSPVAVPAGAGPLLDLGDHRGWVKISAQDTDGTFLLAEVEADPGGGVPPHIHWREDETFYILSGHFLFEVGGQTIEARPGDTIFGPRGVPHTWRCLGPEKGLALFLFTPGDNFQAFGLAMAAQGADPQQDMSDPARIAEFVALAERYGITMLPTLK